jgi:hypothetical protein
MKRWRFEPEHDGPFALVVQDVASSHPAALDGDAILAGQTAVAGFPGEEVIIATTNIRHLGRFPGIDAQPWQSIR